MKLFISFSGQPSKAIAEVLRANLPLILGDTQCFTSGIDIPYGAPWFDKIKEELDDTAFGILCLTPDNINEPWILFEAGALAKSRKGRAAAILFNGLKDTELKPPLSLLHHCDGARASMMKLIMEIDKRQDPEGDGRVVEQRANDYWPKLEAGIEQAIKTHPALDLRLDPRDDSDKIDEILTLVRNIPDSTKPSYSRSISSTRDRPSPLLFTLSALSLADLTHLSDIIEKIPCTLSPEEMSFLNTIRLEGYIAFDTEGYMLDALAVSPSLANEVLTEMGRREEA